MEKLLFLATYYYVAKNNNVVPIVRYKL